MRLLSRLPHRGILESLTPSIIENLKHSNAYVRRNSLQCLYKIHLHFNDELVSDLSDLVSTLLRTETDLGCQRLGFQILVEVEKEKALEYLDENVGGEGVSEEM